MGTINDIIFEYGRELSVQNATVLQYAEVISISPLKIKINEPNGNEIEEEKLILSNSFKDIDVPFVITIDGKNHVGTGKIINALKVKDTVVVLKDTINGLYYILSKE